MKNTLFFLLFTTTGFAQQSTVSGVLTYFNSKRETGQIRYVQNAEIAHANDKPKAQQKLSDASGAFTLTFVGVPEKETVVLKISKEDESLEVVNTDVLECVAGQKSQIKIWMADRRKLAQAQLQFQNNAATAAYNSLDKKLRQKESELKKMQGQANADIQKMTALKQEIALLTAQFDKITELANQLAQRYARINLDEMPPLYAEAYGYFERGDLDSALWVLNRGDLAGQARQVLAERGRIGILQNEINQRDSIQRQKTKDLIDAYSLKLDVHKSRFEFDSLETCYANLLLLDSTDYYTLTRYADYLADRFNNTKAIYYYEQALKFVKYHNDRLVILGNLAAAYHQRNDFAEAEPKYLEIIELHRKAGDRNNMAYGLHNIGKLYVDTKRYTQANVALTEAIDIRKSALKYRSDEKTQALLAGSQNLIAIVYVEQYDYLHAQELYRTALATQKQLADQKPQLYLTGYANTLINLAVLFRDQNKFDSSEYYFTVGLDRLEQFAKINAGGAQLTLALLWTHYGAMKEKKKDYSGAETAYLKALAIRRNLIASDPQTFQHLTAQSLCDLADLYRKQKKYDQAIALYEEALPIRKSMAETGVPIMQTYLGDLYNDLAILFKDQNVFEKADQAYLQALEIYQQVARANPEPFYQGNVARIHNNRGLLFYDQKAYTRAEAEHLEALDIRKRLAANNLESQLNLAKTWRNLSDVYKKTKDFPRGEKACQEALSILRKLADADFNLYGFDLADGIERLGFLYKDQRAYTKTESQYLEALNIYKRLVQTNPETNEPEVARVYNNLGQCYGLMGDPPRAVTAYREAIRLRRLLTERDPVEYAPLLSTSYEDLASVFGDQEDYAQAEEAEVQALALLEKAADPDKSAIAHLCGNLSWYQLFLKKFPAAEQSVKKALMYKPSAVWTKTNLAHALLFQGKYEDAKKVYLELKDQVYDGDPSRKFGGIFVEDLDALEKAGITHPDISRIRELLRQK